MISSCAVDFANRPIAGRMPGAATLNCYAVVSPPWATQRKHYALVQSCRILLLPDRKKPGPQHGKGLSLGSLLLIFAVVLNLITLRIEAQINYQDARVLPSGTPTNIEHSSRPRLSTSWLAAQRICYLSTPHVGF
jgi:hypothetical protein